MFGASQFRSTHWSVVLASGQGDSKEADIALEKLCRTYWYPIYSYVRRKVRDPHEAQDLTQSFFALLIGRKDFARLDPQKGKFRSFLLTALNHFLANHWDHQRRLKRGGGKVVLSWDAQEAEVRFESEPASHDTPERIFDQRWLETLLETVLVRLREEIASQGQAERFDLLKVYLVEDRDAAPFSEMAKQLGVTEAAVKGVVRRLRTRYRELFREEVANTVSKPEELEEEIRQLLGSLRS